MTDKRKPGQSQLDYLWTNFGGLEISNEISPNPSQDILLTESGIIKLINNSLKHSNLKLESKVDDTSVTLIIKDQIGNIVSQTKFDKGAIITGFDKFISTQEDVDNGIVNRVGSQCIRLKDSIGQEFIIELYFSGSETDTIITSVNQGKVAAQVKIDNPIVDRSVELTGSSNGIQANLVIDNNSSVKIVKSRNGVSCKYTWEDEEVDIKFKAITFEAYNLITPDNGTVYFITSHPSIFFRGARYTAAVSAVEYFTKQEVITELNNLKKQILGNVSDDFNTLEKIQKKLINNQISWWEE